MNINNIISDLPLREVGTFIDDGLDKPSFVVKEILNLTNSKQIFEIGTHVGHSALLFLINDAVVYSTDIDGEWTTTKKLLKVQEVFNSNFPNKYNQIIESSQNHDFFINYFSKIKLDMIHIDGLHTFEFCKNDIKLGKKLKIKYFLIDDFQHEEMESAANSENLILIKRWTNIHSGGVDIGLLKNNEN